MVLSPGNKEIAMGRGGRRAGAGRPRKFNRIEANEMFKQFEDGVETIKQLSERFKASRWCISDTVARERALITQELKAEKPVTCPF